MLRSRSSLTALLSLPFALVALAGCSGEGSEEAPIAADSPELVSGFTVSAATDWHSSGADNGCAAQDGAGNLYIASRMGYSVKLGSLQGAAKSWGASGAIISLTKDGAPRWVTVIDSSPSQWPGCAIAVSKLGEVFVGTKRLGSKLVERLSNDGTSVGELAVFSGAGALAFDDARRELVVVGMDNQEGVIERRKEDGTLLERQKPGFGAPLNFRSKKLERAIVAPGGDLVVSGRSKGYGFDTTVFVARIGRAGSIDAYRAFASTEDFYDPAKLAVDAAGNVFFAAQTLNANAGLDVKYTDLLGNEVTLPGASPESTQYLDLVSLDADLNVRWHKGQNIRSAELHAMLPDDAGGVHLVGETWNGVELGALRRERDQAKRRGFFLAHLDDKGAPVALELIGSSRDGFFGAGSLLHGASPDEIVITGESVSDAEFQGAKLGGQSVFALSRKLSQLLP